jgi:5-methylcytosine-specific restriction endonuclease McrA
MQTPYVPVNAGKPCAICSSPLVKYRKTYCSDACAAVAFKNSDAYRRAQAKRNSKPRAKVERVCAQCDQPWMVEKGSPSRYCSRRCSAEARTGRPCPRQGKPSGVLVHVGPPDPVCWLPAVHPVMRPKGRPTRRVFVGATCVWCDTTFVVAGQTNARYCSRRCSRAYDRAARGRFSIRPSTRTAIYERDQWTCQLCSEPVDQDLASEDPFHDWAPSLDHIIPQSKGGSHAPWNLRLAHRWCNAVRGAEDYHSDLFVAA